MIRNNRNKRRRKRKLSLKDTRIRAGLAILAVLTVILAVRSCASGSRRNLDVDASEPEIDVQLLDVNAYSRPGINTDTITGIVIHYTANRLFQQSSVYSGDGGEQQFCHRPGRRDHTVRPHMGSRLCLQ